MQDSNDPNKPKTPPPQTAKMPTGKIGNLDISRLIIGGNLIGGWAHSRDLIYVSKLFKAYNTQEKIFETLALAEQHGINTILLADSLLGHHQQIQKGNRRQNPDHNRFQAKRK